MAAKDLETTIIKGVEDGKIPHAMVFATKRDGVFSCRVIPLRKIMTDYNLDRFIHLQVHHRKRNYLNDEAIEEKAAFPLASQTKLLTTITALQIVEWIGLNWMRMFLKSCHSWQIKGC
ncbi:hypothetical protein M433DRAFT_150832 [Acidomyces richmondensis BFW]|nr:MAG: hypothetical protein FE78DRAFT_86867 [Acidomyces sp. 'richmondensis']KYG48652.1 hypothetical protein M433DRAFT_150832 [Acidomyces richmondensis BFW]